MVFQDSICLGDDGQGVSGVFSSPFFSFLILVLVLKKMMTVKGRLGIEDCKDFLYCFAGLLGYMSFLADILLHFFLAHICRIFMAVDKYEGVTE